MSTEMPPSPASAGNRFGNFLIDLICVYIFAVLVGFLFGLFGGANLLLSIPEFLLAVILVVVYYSFFEGIWGRTPGKLVTGTKVVCKDGTALTFGKVFARSLVRMVPFEPFSFLQVPYSGWHDSFTNTLVVTVSGLSNSSTLPLVEASEDRPKLQLSKGFRIFLYFVLGLILLVVLFGVLIDVTGGFGPKG